MIALLVGLAWAECPESESGIADVHAELDGALEAYAQMDAEAFSVRVEKVGSTLECTRELIDPATAARIHRVLGLGNTLGGLPAGVDPSFAAAWLVDPHGSLPADVVPAGGVVDQLIQRSTVAEPTPRPLEPADGVRLRVDGALRNEAWQDLPAVVQASIDGAVVWTSILEPDEGLPDHLRHQEPVVEVVDEPLVAVVEAVEEPVVEVIDEPVVEVVETPPEPEPLVEPDPEPAPKPPRTRFVHRDAPPKMAGRLGVSTGFPHAIGAHGEAVLPYRFGPSVSFALDAAYLPMPQLFGSDFAEVLFLSGSVRFYPLRTARGPYFATGTQTLRLLFPGSDPFAGDGFSAHLGFTWQKGPVFFGGEVVGVATPHQIYCRFYDGLQVDWFTMNVVSSVGFAFGELR